MAIYRREQRINVYDGTMEAIKAGVYTNDRGEDIEFDLGNLIKGTRFYRKVKKTENFSGRFETKIYTQQIDCVQKATEFGKDGALLNMASRHGAGGGVKNGSSAQEEEICRRTTLGYSIYLYDPKQKGTYTYDESLKSFDAYPMMSDRCGIWSPGVEIFRRSQNGHYGFMTNPGITNVITVPGVQKPELTEDGRAFKEYHARMWRNKIRTVLRLALIGGATKLILGAWGCGAYGNPPALVAPLFKEILGEPEFTGAFSEICFAIIEDKNSAKGGNYGPFAEVFGHK